MPEDYLIAQYNRKIDAALAEWSSASLAAAVELRMAMEQRNRDYIEGPPPVETERADPLAAASEINSWEDMPAMPADGDETAPGSAGETEQESQQAAA